MDNQIIQIEKLESNDFILTFDVNQFSKDIDGHKWSLLIDSYSKKESIDLGKVNHDPESDFYTATANSIEPLQKIAIIIERLTSDKLAMENTLESLSSKYHDEDDMSLEEWLNFLEEAGYDMTKPRKVDFLFSAMQDKAPAKSIINNLIKAGYKTEMDTLDGDFIITAQAVMLPKLGDILEVEEKLRTMASTYGVIYIDCSL